MTVEKNLSGLQENKIFTNKKVSITSLHDALIAEERKRQKVVEVEDLEQVLLLDLDKCLKLLVQIVAQRILYLSNQKKEETYSAATVFHKTEGNFTFS